MPWVKPQKEKEKKKGTFTSVSLSFLTSKMGQKTYLHHGDFRLNFNNLCRALPTGHRNGSWLYVSLICLSRARAPPVSYSRLTNQRQRGPSTPLRRSPRHTLTPGCTECWNREPSPPATSWACCTARGSVSLFRPEP